jgi:hypothetical protein
MSPTRIFPTRIFKDAGTSRLASSGKRSAPIAPRSGLPP